uniref:Cyclic AMP-dependent transcription factor ATF-4 n=1 Tax=Haplochromis burtoni TaxID=8153 RepID=A0A3Q3BRT2_HAPBU
AMTLSQLALEDVEALYLGPSFLMADPMGPLLDQDEEEALSPSSLEGKAPASPSLSLSTYPSSSSPYQTMSFSPLSLSSPSPSPTHCSSFLGTKAGVDSLSLSWLGAGDLLDAHVGADDGKDDAFAGMDWMSEKIDLSEFDLESFIGSCSSDESPSSPEDLLASLDSSMDLDLDPFNTNIPVPHSSLELSLPLPDIPSPPLELPLPTTSLTIIPDPSGSVQSTPIVLSIPTSGHFVVVLSNKEDECDSDSGIESAIGSPVRLPSPLPTPPPAAGSSRTKPYSKSEASTSPKTSKVKSVSGAPRGVEKKLKKMEQNKTAATRYRQKKRVEQEELHKECEELEKKNHELAEKAESISREIQYLKDLMEEVRKHRRVKTNSVA